MPGLNYLAIIVATLVAFVASAVWYILFSKQRAALSSATSSARPSPVRMLIELMRTLVLVIILAGLSMQLGLTSPLQAVLLAVALWIAFPILLLSGSVMYENVPWRLAAIHAGDWL